MRRIIAALCMGLTLLSLTSFVSATTVSGLYEALVPVAGEDLQSRNAAIAEALGQVLVKVTGREPPPGRAELAPQAARYVQQFRYRRETGPEGEPQTKLWVRFDKVGLNRVLRDRDLPLWGSSRPGVLVWLGTDIGGVRRMVGVESDLAPALHAAAEARGLPVQLPLLDLEDQGRLTSADLWSDYGPAVLQASERYSQPLVLSGRLRQVAENLWRSRWTLYEGARSQQFEASGEDAASAIAQAVAQLTDTLAARYAPAGGQGGPETLLVQIRGVSGLADYARAFKLVSERQVVERVALRSAEGDSLLLEVMARGGRDGLSAVLDLVRGLKREPDPMRITPPLPTFELTPPPAPPAPPASRGVDGEPFDLSAPKPATPVEAVQADKSPEIDLIYSLRP